MAIAEMEAIRNLVAEESRFKRRLKELLGSGVEVLSSDVERGYVVISMCLAEGEEAERKAQRIRKVISTADGGRRWKLIAAWVSAGSREVTAAYVRGGHKR